MSQHQQPPQRGASGIEREQQNHGQASAGSSRRFPTASYLSADVRESMIQRLNCTLADLTVLQTQAKYAHWNVKGMAFYGLHDLFDDLADALADHVDLVAERITALGGQAMGTAGQAVADCRLPAMPTDAVTGQAFVDVVTERLAIFDANLYRDIQAATDCGDVDTADLLNEVSRDVSTYLWFVEAHLQTEPVGTTGAGRAPDGTTRPAASGQPVREHGTQQRPAASPQRQGPGQQPAGAQGRQQATPGAVGSAPGPESARERTDRLVAAGLE